MWSEMSPDESALDVGPLFIERRIVWVLVDGLALWSAIESKEAPGGRRRAVGKAHSGPACRLQGVVAGEHEACDVEPGG